MFLPVCAIQAQREFPTLGASKDKFKVETLELQPGEVGGVPCPCPKCCHQ